MPRADWGWINVTPYYDTTTFTPGGGGGGGWYSCGTSSNTTDYSITFNGGTVSNNWTTSNTYTLQNYWGNDVINDPWGPAPAPTWRLVDEGTGREVERVARSEARALARTAARDRADELLQSMLSEQQREAYRLTGEFEVMGSAGGVYRIRRGTSGNVDWIAPDGTVGARLCAHPEMREGWMPDQDVALAQMLALRTDEAGFIGMANVHAGRRPSHLVVA